jgi:hypothetical protein
MDRGVQTEGGYIGDETDSSSLSATLRTCLTAAWRGFLYTASRLATVRKGSAENKAPA